MTKRAALESAGVGSAYLLGSRPTGCGSRRGDGHDLTGARTAGPVPRTPPILADDEKRPALGSAKDAGERAAIELDRLEHLSAFTNANAALISDVGVPGAACSIEADPIGMVVDLRPFVSIRQASVP